MSRFSNHINSNLYDSEGVPITVNISLPRSPVIKNEIDLKVAKDKPFSLCVLPINIRIHILKTDQSSINELLSVSYMFEDEKIAEFDLPILILDTSN